VQYYEVNPFRSYFLLKHILILDIFVICRRNMEGAKARTAFGTVALTRTLQEAVAEMSIYAPGHDVFLESLGLEVLEMMAEVLVRYHFGAKGRPNHSRSSSTTGDGKRWLAELEMMAEVQVLHHFGATLHHSPSRSPSSDEGDFGGPTFLPQRWER
jgi:hypothetical protein